MWVVPMKSLPDLLFQTAYSAIDSYFVLFDGLDDLKSEETRRSGNLTMY